MNKQQKGIDLYKSLWVGYNPDYEADAEADAEANAEAESDAKAEASASALTELSLGQRSESEIPIDIKEIQKIKRLGSGTSGTTYLATSPARPNESLVLKIIPKIESQINAQRRDVEREVAILKDLQERCENYTICYVDFQSDDDNYYILTVYDENFMDLSEYLDSLENPLNRDDLIIIMHNLLMGLKYIHQHGVVHRDIKPANILINPETGLTKIIDFGLSCRTLEQDSSQENQECLKTGYGSAWYVSPELFLKRPVKDPNYFANDVWSLGMVFHELLKARRQDPYNEKFPHNEKELFIQRAPRNYQRVNTLDDLNNMFVRLFFNKGPKFDYGPLVNHTLFPVVQMMLNPVEVDRATITQSFNKLHEIKRSLENSQGSDSSRPNKRKR